MILHIEMIKRPHIHTHKKPLELRSEYQDHNKQAQNTNPAVLLYNGKEEMKLEY